MINVDEQLGDRPYSFFGCDLDSDEKEGSIQEKLAVLGETGLWTNPYAAIMDLMKRRAPRYLFQEAGSMDVPGWLRPVPPLSVREKIKVADFVAFIDQDGCRRVAEEVKDFIRRKIHPAGPVLIGIDHSLTGGIFRYLKEEYGPEISLIVLDSHLDALSVPVLAGAIAYDLETNPHSIYDAHDPFLRNRIDSYNASSFLHHLVNEGTLASENLYVIGIGDYPPKRAFRVQDDRIKQYVGVYKDLKEQGATILTKKDLVDSPRRLENILARIETPYAYISIDLDIGAGEALNGVRFRDRRGLNAVRLRKIAQDLRNFVDDGPELLGLDITEINPRLARADQTYQLAADLIQTILFGGKSLSA